MRFHARNVHHFAWSTSPDYLYEGDVFERIVSHRMPLGEAPRAYEVFDRKLDGCTKAVLVP